MEAGNSHPSRPPNTAVTVPLTTTDVPEKGVAVPEPWTAEIAVMIPSQRFSAGLEDTSVVLGKVVCC